MQAAAIVQPVGIAKKLGMAGRAARTGGRRRGLGRSGVGGPAQPCTIAFSIMQ